MPQPTSVPLIISPPHVSRLALGLLTVMASCAMSSRVGAQDRQARADYLKKVAEAQALKKPLLKDFAGAEKKFKQRRSRYLSALSKGAKTPAETKLVNDGIEFKILYLSNPDLVGQKLTDWRQSIEKDIQSAGSQISGQRDEVRFRAKVMEQVVQTVERLLDGNYDVRLQAASILQSLNTLAKKSGRSQKPWPESRAALVKIVTDRNQLAPIKLVAANGLIRFVRFGDLGRGGEMEIARLLVAEINEPASSEHYKLVLLSQLRHVHYTNETRGRNQPIVIMAGVSVLTDTKMSWFTRSVAARTIGSTGDGTGLSSWEPLVYKSTETVYHALLAHNKAIEQNKKSSILTSAGEFFFAFHHDSRQALAEKRGFKNRGSKYAEDAYRACLPGLKALIGDQTSKDRVPDAAVTKLKDWLEKNPPKTWKYHPAAPPIVPNLAGNIRNGNNQNMARQNNENQKK